MSEIRELAHEIRTPLAAIISNNDLLERAFHKLRERLSANADSETRDLLAIVEESLRVNRIACQRLESLVRSVHDERQKTDIHAILEDALSLLNHELKDRIRILRDFGEIAAVKSRAVQLQQAFTNLLLNAAQAIKGPGEIRIKTRQEGLTVQVAISDNGPGIPLEIRERIFERGFTTRSADSGAGLGLWICRKIIEDHGGRIEVDSTAGAGATFTTILPAADDSERKADE